MPGSTKLCRNDRRRLVELAEEGGLEQFVEDADVDIEKLRDAMAGDDVQVELVEDIERALEDLDDEEGVDD
jgi:hypothetical protein